MIHALKKFSAKEKRKKFSTVWGREQTLEHYEVGDAAVGVCFWQGHSPRPETSVLKKEEGKGMAFQAGNSIYKGAEAKKRRSL